MSAGRVVFDTSTVLSAFLFSNSVPGKAMSLAELQFTLLSSEASLAEMRTVFSRAKFDKYVPRGLRLRYVDRYESVAEFVEIRTRIEACRDAKDNLVLELATDGEAIAIVTGDKDLLVLDPFRGIRILTANQFLVLFGRDFSEWA